MWLPRTPEEVEQWHAATRREAKFQITLLTVLIWLGLSALVAGGWIAGNRFGVVVQESVSGTFWSRFLLFTLVGSPIAFWAYRHELRKDIAKSNRMTICPQCEQSAAGNIGATCDCGGSFVPQSTVKWVEPEPTDKP